MTKIIGIGTGAGMILSALEKVDQSISCSVIGTNTTQLDRCEVVNKLLIGEERLRGLGARGDLEAGRSAVFSSLSSIRELIEESKDLVILVACLGGGTGSGGIVELAKIARKKQKTTLCVLSYPFSFEGPQRARNAQQALKEVQEVCSVFVFPNDRIMANDGHLSMKQAMEKSQNQLATCAKDLADLYAAAAGRSTDLAKFRLFLGSPGLRYASSAAILADEDCTTTADRILQTEQFPGSGLTGAEHALVQVSAGSSGLSHAEISNLWTGMAGHLGHDRLLIGVTLNHSSAASSLTICAGGYDNAPIDC